jgi:hypothetical protein
MPIVSDDVLKLSQPAVIVLFAPMLMHLQISFFTSEKENPLSEDETHTGTTTEANEPIEVDDDVSHEASENKEQGKFQSFNNKTFGPSSSKVMGH